MLTRCFIGLISDGKGRYCHWDGYPTHMVDELAKIYKRDGYDKMMNVIVDNNKQWSSIDSNATGAKPDDPTMALAYEIIYGTNDDRFSWVEGYGQVNHDNDQDNSYETLEAVGDYLDYGYMIGEDGTIRVYITPDKYTEFNVKDHNRFTSQDIEYWVEHNL